MRIIVICIMLMLIGCNVQPNNTIESNTQSNSNTEKIEENTVKNTETKNEEKVFLLVEEQYYIGNELYDGINYYYDDLGRLIGEESSIGYIEYEYIDDSDKVKSKYDYEVKYTYEYDNLGRLKLLKEVYGEDVYSETKYKYQGELLIEEFTNYILLNTIEIKSYRYVDGKLEGKYIETINNDTGESYSYMYIYTFGEGMDKPVTEECYYNGTMISNIYRNKYKEGLLVKKEEIYFIYGTTEMSSYSKYEYEYDEYNNLISEKYYEDDFMSEIKYIYEEFK